MTMFSKLKQIKDLRDQAKTIQNVLKDVTVEGSAAWGKVAISMNGNQEVTSVKIDQELLSDKAKLESAMKDAYNDTVKKAQRAMADAMKKSGMELPGMN